MKEISFILYRLTGNEEVYSLYDLISGNGPSKVKIIDDEPHHQDGSLMHISEGSIIKSNNTYYRVICTIDDESNQELLHLQPLTYEYLLKYYACNEY